ncbi:MAG: site-specific integrase [Microthrixaceae bacterium]|nr:site-specific integrase [Microthrixaceae bacterium]
MARERRRTGHVRELLPGVWQVSAEAQPDPVTGQRRRVYRKVRGKYRDADRALAKLVAEIAAGQATANAGTLEAFANHWHHAMATRWEPATAMRHRQDLDVHILPTLGRRRLADLTADDLTALYANLTATGLAPRTVQHVHGTIRALLNHAVATGKLARSPAAAALVPKRKRTNRPLPTAGQLDRVLELAHTDSDGMWGAWLRVAFYTGARPAEINALRWADIDLDAGAIHYRRAIGRAFLEDGRRGWAQKGTKTHSETRTGERTVPIDRETTAVLRRWRLTLAERLLASAVAVSPFTVVFPADKYGQTPFRPDTSSKRWRRYALEAGVDPTIRLYDASRHAHVSWCLSQGFPAADVAARVGNSPETIYRFYAHLLQPESRAIADAIDFGSQPNPSTRPTQMN